MKPVFRPLLVAALACVATAVATAADWVLVAHPDSAPASLSKEDVKNILLGNKTKWDAGGLIKLAVLTEGPVHDAVIQNFAARTADQFDKYWKKQVFTGKGVAPEAFKTDAELVAYVAKTPGAFGYVATGSAGTGVKTVAVP